MDWTTVFHALFSTQTPTLPELALMRPFLHVSWAVVLACMVMWLGHRWPRRFQLGLAGLLLGWTLLPGPVSPAFWLGLAFQVPSLMSTAICLASLLAIRRTGARRLSDPAQMRALQWAGLGGVALGWLLLLDTFAVLPVSLYAIGFSPAAVGVTALLASLPWMLFGPGHPWRVVSGLLGGVLLLQVLLRLPSGNLWDALIDPWLWLALQLGWLARGLRCVSAALRGSAATRA